MELECPAQRGGLGRGKGSERLEGAMAQELIGVRDPKADKCLLEVSVSWLVVYHSFRARYGQ